MQGRQALGHLAALEGCDMFPAYFDQERVETLLSAEQSALLSQEQALAEEQSRRDRRNWWGFCRLSNRLLHGPRSLSS